MKLLHLFSGEWSEFTPGVVTSFVAIESKEVALTLDLCGSSEDGFNEEIYRFLLGNKIPALFFVSGLWARKHPEQLSKVVERSDLFEIGNHGLRHRPGTVSGRISYGAVGPLTKLGFKREVTKCQKLLFDVTGSTPRFYRSGGGFYDKGAIKVLRQLSLSAVGFSVLGDAGTTYSDSEAESAVSEAKTGDIIIAHANWPDRDCAKGVISGLNNLLKRDYKFVRLRDRKLVD